MTSRLRRIVVADVALAVAMLSCGSGSAVASGDSQGRAASAGGSIHTSWHVFTEGDGLPQDSVRAIRVFGDQTWVGTDGGLAMYENGEWTTWTRSDGLPVSAVSAIDIDPETLDVWLGTWGGGIVRFSAGRFDQFNQFNSGLAGDLVFDIAVAQGRVWAATSGGVSSYDASAEEWELYYPRKASGPESAVTTLVAEGDDLYAGLWQGGVGRFDSATRRWTTIASDPSDTLPEGLGPGARSSLQADDAVGIEATGQSLWWATQSAVLWKPRSDLAPPAKVWRVWPIPRMESRPGFVRCVASPGGAQVWLGTDRGLYILADSAASGWLHLQSDSSATVYRSGEQVEMRRLSSTIPDDRIRSIAFDGDVVWIGTAGGLARGDDLKPLATLPLTAGDDAPSVAPRDKTSDPETSVAVAIYGPRNRPIALPGKIPGVPAEPGRPDLLAVEISIGRANARGGYRDSSPFDLVMVSPGYSRYGWGLPEDNIVIFSHDHRVMGMIGYLATGRHVADAVALRTEVSWVNVAPAIGEGGPSAEANPWVFRCHGDEPARHRMLLDHILDRIGHKRIALLRTEGRAAAARQDWWRSHAEERGHPLVAELEWSRGRNDHTETLAALRTAKPDVVVTWCDKGTTADILREMRAAGIGQPIVVSSECVSDDFAALVGVDPGGVIALDPTSPEPVARNSGQNDSDAKSGSFAERYARRNVLGGGRAQPSALAYRSFTAAGHLLDAVSTAGPDREAVRRTLEAMSRSSTGEAHYERLFEEAPTRFARLKAGRWVYQPLPAGGAETRKLPRNSQDRPEGQE